MTEWQTNDPEVAYLKAAIAYHEASLKPGFKAVNRAHDAVLRAAREILEREDGGRAFLHNLLTHPFARVRLWAASHLLPLDEHAAIRVLSEIANSENPEASLIAEYAISEWKSGEFDPHFFLKDTKRKQ